MSVTRLDEPEVSLHPELLSLLAVGVGEACHVSQSSESTSLILRNVWQRKSTQSTAKTLKSYRLGTRSVFPDGTKPQ